MKTLTWNVRRATEKSDCWKVIEGENPDFVFLQEVVRIPNYIKECYDIISKSPKNKNGKPQKFKTAVLSKFQISEANKLISKKDWINREYEHFDGNILYCSTRLNSSGPLNLISVYSPAWFIPDERLEGIDVSAVKLENNPKIYCTEILFALLKDNVAATENWIVSGDFNSSTTFDWMWGKSPRGNQEIIDRLNSLGLVDGLSSFNKGLVPTFRNPSNKKIIHQLDYIYLSENLLKTLKYSKPINDKNIFENQISDHLPIVTELKF
jgi:endonuclease/exonuclease/phosphatase family metal-dependent hydrolase|tara:strand:- start:201 stop:998 length:798 start_codon:yes stop_codon:yes gene_type:complete